MRDTAAFTPDWTSYYQAVATSPPRHTLVRTLTLCDLQMRSSAADRAVPQADPDRLQTAVDLGCGSGRDTRLLLERGWQVHAFDLEATAIDRLQESLADRPDLRDRLEADICSFERIIWPAAVQLVNASFSLPFCHPEGFGALWSAIEVALSRGGWFCGQFFGDRDDWATYSNITALSRAEVSRLLDSFSIVELEEEEYDGTTALDTPKHWHVFHVIAQRP